MYKGAERRKFPRILANFIISYCPEVISGEYDLTQTKNISQGGVLFTTKEGFEKGTYLRMRATLPISPYRIEEIGRVVESQHLPKNHNKANLYETRVKFSKLNTESFSLLGKFIKTRLKVS